METYLDLTKGLHTDFEPIDQPAGTYKYLKDAIRQLSGSIENEEGTIEIFKFIEDDRRVVGSYVLDADTIYFSYSPSSALSEIGILVNGAYSILTQDASLAFSLSIIIRAEGKKNFKGDRIIYFVGKGLPMRVLNLDKIPAVNFGDVTKLVLTATMPQVGITDIIEGGSLPTGIYQFGTRLLTKSTNSTGVSILSNYIPIVNEALTNRDEYDGAPPQTESNKAIVLSINNIDSNYEFLEIIVVTAIGTGNITRADVIARVPIQGRSQISFTYSSITQARESLDINALVTDQVNYDSAEFINQKDGILTFASLTASVDNYNFQTAANGITIKYVIKEEIWQENINISNGVDIGSVYSVGNDYKNPKQVLEFKSYMRDEVYSFAVVPIYKNWNMGNAYHIPGREDIAAGYNVITANTVTKQLGTYYSTDLYPDDKGYPAFNTLYGKKIRHHQMPTLIQEPHVQVRNGTTYVRMLGISVDLTSFIAAIPDAVKNNIIGYVIVKQKRTEGNKSILSQGIASTHVNTGDVANKIFAANPVAQLPYIGGDGAGNGQYKPLEDVSMVAFYSPEATMLQDTMKSATIIKPVIELDGTSYRVADKRTSDDKYAYVLLNYHSTTYSTTFLNSARPLNSNVTQQIPAGKEVTNADINKGSDYPSVNIGALSKQVLNWKNPGYLFLNISSGGLPKNDVNYGDGKGEVFYKFESGATDGLYLNNSDTATTGSTSRHLYNLIRTLGNQYGDVFSARYHYVKHILLINTPSSVIECFNGDTFITKFSVIASTCLTAIRNGGGSNPTEDFGVTVKGLSYMWLESSVNCGLRHFEPVIGKEGDANYKQGTLPYYPKIKSLHSDTVTSPGIFDYSSSLGHSTGYNKQYSFENTIRSYFPTPLELEIVTAYPNKIIYSEQSVEGEQLDAFRVFLPNNFHDIPRSKGRITNLFIIYNTLFVHVERSLWKTYFNEQVTQASSAGEVYLGNGGVFNRPSTEITSVAGGYGGTTTSCGTTTPFGHFFVDTIYNKAFMFDGKELKEISEQGMFNFFKSNIENLVDTPALGVGYSASYDYIYERWILTKIGAWTLSYSTKLNSWSGFHTYLPYHYVTVGDRLFSVNTNSIHEMNVGVRGAYYGEIPTDMRLDIVINDTAKDTKTLDNIVLYSTSQNADGKEQHYDTFNTLQVSNITKNTGKCRLIVPRKFEDEFVTLGLFECFAKLKSNEFRIAIPNDLVIDVELDIFDETNLDISRAYRPRLSGKYFIASLSYNNLRDNKFVLHNIGRLFRQRIR